MKIHSMTATFGKLENQTLDLKTGLNIISAPNEWGKSTWCAFLATMLYGLDTREKTTKTVLAVKERYAPWSGSPMSGRIDLNWNGRDITIERWSKGRTPMGEFRAYETESGLPVAELTGANCGQMLLGVEKSVFLRAGFLRLADLPVTEDEALRRRLNALVTTGDESGTGDLLAQKLKDLKNKCRSNRVNGLIPQAEMEKAALEEKLAELAAAQKQQATIIQRQQELEVQIAGLENHKKVLEYAAGEENNRRILQAQLRRDEAKNRLEQLSAQCADLPDAQQAKDASQQLRQLHQDSMALDLEQQMLPPAPQPPKYTDENAAAQELEDTLYAREAFQKYLDSIRTFRKLGRAALIHLLATIPAAIITWLIFQSLRTTIWVSLVPLLSGSLVWILFRILMKERQRILSAFVRQFGAPDCDAWVQQAQAEVDAQAAYATKLAEHEQILATFQEKREALATRIARLTQEKSIGECLQYWEAVSQKWDDLQDAHQVYANAASHAEALSAMAKPVDKPTMPDHLTWSEPITVRLLADAAFEQKQLQIRLGQCQGRMDALGAESELQAKLDAVNTRLDKLHQTYQALELALQSLEKASAELQRRFAPRIAKQAQELFGKLTGGRYDRLTLSHDLSVNAGTAEETVLRTAQWRSEGTADQLYLALRLAVARELTPEAPLILDDALVRFDDVRHAAAMGILKEEAEQKQIILFTCQSRENPAL